jgi:hypothetical protein
MTKFRKKYNHLASLIILHFCLIALMACGIPVNNDGIAVTNEDIVATEDTASESVDESESIYDAGNVRTFISDTAKEQLRWENLKTSWPLSVYLDDLGRPVEYGLVTSPPSYTWYPDGKEMYQDEFANFFFSGPVWDENSVCVGISTLLDTILPDWTGETISAEGISTGGLGNVYWESPTGETTSYYVYDEDGVICKLPASNDGKSLLPDAPVLIQSKTADAIQGMMYSDSSQAPLSPELRIGEEWAVINQYAAKIGMSEEEIIAGIASGGPMVNRFNYNVYKDYVTEAEYSFGSGKCDFIYLTVDKAFPGFGDKKDGAAFIQEINSRTDWSGDFASYAYAFEDCAVYVLTDGDRNIFSDSSVIIREVSWPD